MKILFEVEWKNPGKNIKKELFNFLKKTEGLPIEIKFKNK